MKKVPLLGGEWRYVDVLVVCEVWEVCWILKAFWLCQCFHWVMDIWYKCEVFLLLDIVRCSCLCLLLWNLQILLWVSGRDVVVSDGLISNVWNSFFWGPIGFTYYSAVELWAGHFQWQIMLVFWASGMGCFGWMSKHLMVLVPFKKTLTLPFAWVHLHKVLQDSHYLAQLFQ